MRTLSNLCRGLLCLATSFAFLVPVAFAQVSEGANSSQWFKTEILPNPDVAVGDFVTGPGNIEVSVKPGESVTVLMTVANRISDNRRFQLSIEDMSGSADPKDAVVLLGDSQGPYTLKDYISFPANNFTLALGERAQIPVTITMPPNAEPGGYYGAVLVSTVQDSGDETAAANSPIVARIGTLFFITVPGEVERLGEFTDFITIPERFIFSQGPIKFGMLFENNGSMYLNPYGEVQIHNIFGDEVGFLEIDPWFVLPQSLRLREFSWDRELLLGLYTVTAKLNRGYGDIVDEKTMHIWVLPWQLFASVFGVVFALLLIIKFVRRNFEFRLKSKSKS